MPKELQRLDNCLNCGSPTGGNYCSECGQENEDRTTSLKPLFSDFFAEVLSFDSKLTRTLIDLLRHPGKLTNAYNAGRRVSYLSPLKMYLVFTGVFFLVMSFQMDLNVRNPFNRPQEQTAEKPDAKAPKQKPKTDDKKPKEDEVDEVRDAAHGLAEINPMGITINRSGVTAFGRKLPRTLEEYDAQQAALPVNKRDKGLAHLMSRQSLKLSNNPGEFLHSLVFDSTPKVMFVLLPVVASILWLLYIRSKRFYVEHLIFSLHCQSFTFIAMALIALIPFELTEIILPIWVAGYMLVAMRVVYRQSWPKTIFKWGILGIAYLTLLSFGVIAAAMLSLATF